jgi:hypothetical protein
VIESALAGIPNLLIKQVRTQGDLLGASSGLRFDTAMPALTCRDPNRAECWHVYFDDVRVGTIARRRAFRPRKIRGARLAASMAAVQRADGPPPPKTAYQKNKRSRRPFGQKISLGDGKPQPESRGSLTTLNYRDLKPDDDFKCHGRTVSSWLFTDKAHTRASSSCPSARSLR